MLHVSSFPLDRLERLGKSYSYSCFDEPSPLSPPKPTPSGHPVLAFEAAPYNGSQIFQGVPDAALPILQYYNIPIESTPGSIRNPLEIIRRIAARGRDFVALKLDIDSYPEEEIFVQLLGDESLDGMLTE